MSTKEKFIKVVVPCLAAVVVAVVLTICFMPKDKPLSIRLQDVKATINETFEIKYEVSDPYAKVDFEIEDENVVERVAGTINSFVAKDVGNTTIIVRAKTDSKQAVGFCKIEIEGKEEPDDSNTEQQTKPEVKPKEEENKFSISGVEGNTLQVGDSGKLVTFVFDETPSEITFVPSDGVSIVKMESLGGAYLIRATCSGQIELFDQGKPLGKILIEKI